MYQSLRTLSTTDFQDEFEKLKTDNIELLLTKEGFILSVNETGKSLFSENESFFNYVPLVFKKQTEHFIQNIMLQGTCMEVPLLQTFQDKGMYIQYNGMYTGEYILLTGNTSTAAGFSIETSEMLQQFEHASVIVNADMNMEMCNNAFHSYMEMEDLDNRNEHLSKDIYALTSTKEGLDVAPKLIEEVLEKQKSLDLEVKNEQSEKWLYLKGVYLKGTNCVLLMIYDLTYEKKYHHLLTYQDQMESVSYLSAGVAHELRNPLSVIKGFLQLSSLTESFYKYSDTILSEVERMNEIIDNFLSVARKKVKKESKAPGDLLESVIDIMRSECLMQGVHFHYSVEPLEGSIEVNESSFKQIILNALRNSMDAFPEGKKDNAFSLKSFQDKNYLIVRLEDNGQGIPAQVLQNLGKPFFTTKEKGTGVGIPLCKKIMHEHNGSFDIESEEGEGTVITLSFPLIHH